MTEQLPSSDPRPRRGAPAGNDNALKHGRYAKQGFYHTLFKKADQNLLQKCEISGLQPEIDLMRMYIRHIMDLGKEVEDLNQAIALLHAVSHAVTALNRLIHTQSTVVADAEREEVAREVRRALDEVVEEFGL